MKRRMTALFAALLLLSGCGAKEQTPVQKEEASKTSNTVAVLEKTEEARESASTITLPAEPAQTETKEPAQDTEAAASDKQWLDEPQTTQFDIEEVVSCTYTLPDLTLETSQATEAANAIFAGLAQDMNEYAQNSVYPAAQEKQAIGFVNGGYSITLEENTLKVDYTISVSFSTESSDQQFFHSYTIDLETGELLKEE